MFLRTSTNLHLATSLVAEDIYELMRTQRTDGYVEVNLILTLLRTQKHCQSTFAMSELLLHLPRVSLLVSNMHCPSCCEAITHLLSPLPSIRNLSISLLLRTVTFSVDPSISSSAKQVTREKVVKDVTAILTGEGGFEVDGGSNVPQSSSPTDSKSSKEPLSFLRLLTSSRKHEREQRKEEERRRRHYEHCEACRLENNGEKIDNRHQPLASVGAPQSRSSSASLTYGEKTTKTVV